MKRRSFGLSMGTAAMLVLSGACSTSPIVRDVRSEYEQAAHDPKVTQYAPLELRDAEKEVRVLERIDDAGYSDPRLEHRAYLARRRIEIARSVADQGPLAQQVADATKQRDALLAEASRGRQGREPPSVASGSSAGNDKALASAERLEKNGISASSTEAGVLLTSRDLAYPFNVAELQSGAEPALADVADYLNEFPDRPVFVEGHADSTGPEAFNLDLSDRRAQGVADYLEKQGVDRSRIHVRGFGDEKPVAPNTTFAGRQENRRVDIVLGIAGSEPPAAPKARAQQPRT